MKEDKRGESLLYNLNNVCLFICINNVFIFFKNDKRRGRRQIRNRETIESQSNMTQSNNQNTLIDINKVRNAMKRLNQDWHYRNLSSLNNKITHNIINHDDSD